MNRQKVILICDDPRVLRAMATQARNWIDILEADNPDRAERHIENHPNSAVLVTERLLRQHDGVTFLRDLRHHFPQIRRCLLACYSDLSAVVEAIHGGLIDSLVHMPLTRAQFMAAVTRIPPAMTAPSVFAA